MRITPIFNYNNKIYSTNFNARNNLKLSKINTPLSSSKAYAIPQLKTLVKKIQSIVPPQLPSELFYSMVLASSTNIMGIFIDKAFIDIGLAGSAFLLGKFALNKSPWRVKLDNAIFEKGEKQKLTKEQKLCKNIFICDYSPEGAKAVGKRYSQILQSDMPKNEKIMLLAKNLQLDYRLEKIPVNFWMHEDVQKIEHNLKSAGSCVVNYTKKTFGIEICSSHSINEIFSTLVHEYHHLKQFIISYLTYQSKEEMVDVRIDYIKDHYPENSPEYKNAKENAVDYTEQMYSMYQSLNLYPNAIQPGNKYYRYGRKLIDSARKSTDKNIDAYLLSYAEKDAINAANLMKILLFLSRFQKD